MFQTFYSSPLGTLRICSDGQSLTEICTVPEAGEERADSVTALAKTQLQEYFAGERMDFKLELLPKGTAFQKMVWVALREIPYGETRTYGELAARIGHPNAYRAVGNAAGKNPLLIVVPCHRLVAQNGLGGFSAGLEKKKALLSLEMASAQAAGEEKNRI